MIWIDLNIHFHKLLDIVSVHVYKSFKQIKIMGVNNIDIRQEKLGYGGTNYCKVSKDN